MTRPLVTLKAETSTTGAPFHRWPGRIPSLDGVRAFAITLVLVAHSLKWLEQTRFQPLLRIFGNGALGVEIFFVISGFLITRLLMQESYTTGRISLRQFYLRRTFRILPAFYAFLAFAGILAAAGYVSPARADFLAAGTFLWNYTRRTDEARAHLWSLSVEEQFYLFWPLLLMLIGNRRARIAAGLLVCAAPFIRLGTYAVWPAMRAYIPVMMHTRIDALMFGCFAALA